MASLSGIWLPIITPFHEGEVDLVSYEQLLEHYIELGVGGIFPLGTTGESPTLDDAESEAIVERTLAVVAGRVPVFVGIGGNATAVVLRRLSRLDRYAFSGIVSVCPYYNRPTQDGLAAHFRKIAEATDRQIVIYNIPYRTGVNLTNDTLLSLAEKDNVVGVKDSSGNIAQSLELLCRRPPDFAVMTGEDNFYYTMLAHGADGGILASAHLATADFIAIHHRMRANDHRGALRLWSRLETLVPLLFREANPMPVKYCLWRQGLLRSAECRLPLTQVSPQYMQLKLAWRRTTPNRYAEASLHDAVCSGQGRVACAIAPYGRFSFQVGLRRAGIASEPRCRRESMRPRDGPGFSPHPPLIRPVRLHY